MRNRKVQDLTGNRYGQLVVQYRGHDKLYKNGTRDIMWHCLCDCGHEVDVRAPALKSGNTKSCGCSRIEIMKARKGLLGENLTNHVFHYWTALYRVDDIIESSGRHATVWHCKCKCGNERDVRAHALKSGLSLSCGCYKHEQLSLDRNLIDQYFGRWHVIDKAHDVYSEKSKRTYRRWHCRCECGTERDVDEYALVGGKSVSCGCYRNERLQEVATYEDLSGQVFTNWTVLERVDDRLYPSGGRSQMYKCQCKCGSVHIVAKNMLKLGISQSCGCLNGSVLELHVADYLIKHHYQYETQKVYSDLRGVGNGCLSYDFLVYKNSEPYCFIECQGEQHYRPVDYFGGLQKFLVQQEHDKRKRVYADALGLPVIEVIYVCRSYDDIVSFLDERL